MNMTDVNEIMRAASELRSQDTKALWRDSVAHADPETDVDPDGIEKFKQAVRLHELVKRSRVLYDASAVLDGWKAYSFKLFVKTMWGRNDKTTDVAANLCDMLAYLHPDHMWTRCDGFLAKCGAVVSPTKLAARVHQEKYDELSEFSGRMRPCGPDDWKSVVDASYAVVWDKAKNKRVPSLKAELDRVGLGDTTLVETILKSIPAQPRKFFREQYCKEDRYIGDVSRFPWADSQLSFYKAIVHALDHGYRRILWMEDDVRFVKDTRLLTALLAMFPTEADIVAFDWCLWWRGAVSRKPSVMMLDDVMSSLKPGEFYSRPMLYGDNTHNGSCACVVLSDKAMRACIEFMDRNPEYNNYPSGFIGVDTLLSRDFKGIDKRVSVPRVAQQLVQIGANCSRDAGHATRRIVEKYIVCGGDPGWMNFPDGYDNRAFLMDAKWEKPTKLDIFDPDTLTEASAPETVWFSEEDGK